MDPKEAVEVTVGLTLQQILRVDQKENSLTAIYWINLEWKDELLRWNSTDEEDIDDLRLPVEDIWIPDIELYNKIDSSGLRGKETAVIDSSGHVTWIPPYKLTSTCKMDFTFFPFDEQNCDLKFGSWTYNGWKLDLVLKSSSIDISSYTMNKYWEMVNTSATRNEVFYECCPEPYLDISFTMTLRRRNPTTPTLSQHSKPLPTNSMSPKILNIFQDTEAPPTHSTYLNSSNLSQLMQTLPTNSTYPN